MTNEEREIMADMFYYLNNHSDPPAMNAPDCVEFWTKAGRDLTELVSKKWNNHPLALKLGCALIVYIEDKSKIGGDPVVQEH